MLLQTHIAEELQEHYVPVERRSNMGGVMLLVLVRKDVEPFIRHVYTSGENTGLAGGWSASVQRVCMCARLVLGWLGCGCRWCGSWLQRAAGVCEMPACAQH